MSKIVQKHGLTPVPWVDPCTSAQDYQHDFFAIGLPGLLTVMNAVGPLTPAYIYSDTAQYYFVQTVQGVNITFPVDFDREYGVWKISEF